MSSIKLHEATKQFQISNKLAMFFLEKKNLAVKSHSSVISVDQLELLREFAANPDKFSDIIKAFTQPEDKTKKETPVPEPAPVKEPIKKEVKKEEEKKKEDKAIKSPAEKKQAKPKIEIKEKEVPKKEPEKPVKKTEKTEIKAEPKAKKPAEKPLPEKKAPVREPERPAAPKPESPVEPKKKAPAEAGPEIKKTAPPPEPRPEVREKPAEKPAVEPEVKEKPKTDGEWKAPESMQLPDFISVKELAEKLNCKLRFLEEKLAQMKMTYQGNDFMLKDDIEKICLTLHVQAEIIPFEDYIFNNDISRRHAQLHPRPPVVTVMGHVDHGKTTLLDTLRKTHVAENEAGGITQKIGAYKLKTGEGSIIFIDTPGHEAFTNLRARGAKVTDIVVLVVAANDGVQPQTVEAIQHALAAKVPLIIAINKIDIAGASAEKIRQELSKHNVLVEEWGGDVVSVEISAKLNQNLGNLLEMINLVAQMQELKAYREIPARGTIVESRLDPQLGPIGTVLIQHGQLKRGDFFICGTAVGKIKSIFDDASRVVPSAAVPDPVEIMGFDGVPEAGDIFQVVDSLEKAQKVAEIRRIHQKDTRSKDIWAEKKLSFQNLFQMVEQNKIQVFPMIIKADSFGSQEVMEQLLARQNQEKLKIEIVSKGIGNITEGDILLASTANAVVLGFNVKAPQKIIALAKKENVEIKLYSVIYHLIEEITKAIQGKIAPEYRDTLIGKAQILQKFKISKVGNVAGCMVTEGKVTRKSKVKILRGSDLVFEGEILSLKRIKDEVSEVRAGTECGIRIKNFNDIEPNDTIEFYESVLVS
jgi:translation initiation factor IF-2